MKYYGVRRGRTTGVFESWEACRKQVYQFPRAEYKAFLTREEAKNYVSSSESPRPHPTEKSQCSPSSTIEIWVDGSCLQQTDGSLHLGWGLLVKEKSKEIHRDKGNDIPPSAFVHRNVAGEIFGVLKALQWCQAQGITNGTIYFDYQGLESWATGTWQAKLPFTQAYAKTIQESGITIHWVKVKAHSGNPENEIVDQLAKEAARSMDNKKGGR